MVKFKRSRIQFLFQPAASDGKLATKLKEIETRWGQLTGYPLIAIVNARMFWNGTLVCKPDGASATSWVLWEFYSLQFAKSQSECAQYLIIASCVSKTIKQVFLLLTIHFGSCQAGIDCNDPVIMKIVCREQRLFFPNIKIPVGVICSGIRYSTTNL